jgi:hypothetical protein
MAAKWVKRTYSYFLILQHPACSERCTLDLPGFKKLEGLYIGLFLA